MITRNDLAGEWELQDFTLEKNDKIPTSWREHCTGLLIYTLSGHMSVSINSKITGDKTLSVNKFESILFYSGTYEVDRNLIMHNVMNASDPERIGKKLIRESIREGDSLILIGRGEFGVAKLIWKRVKYHSELKNTFKP